MFLFCFSFLCCGGIGVGRRYGTLELSRVGEWIEVGIKVEFSVRSVSFRCWMLTRSLSFIICHICYMCVHMDVCIYM